MLNIITYGMTIHFTDFKIKIQETARQSTQEWNEKEVDNGFKASETLLYFNSRRSEVLILLYGV